MKSLALLSPAIRRWLTSLVAVLLAACAGDSLLAPSGVPSLARAPGFIDNQSVPVGTQYPQKLGAQITGFAPANGQILNFVVTSGGGSVFANVVATGKPNTGPWAGLNGIAQNVWTLGPTAGPQTVEARLVNPVNGATITTAVFHAVGLPGPAALIKVAAGNQQAALAGSAVAVSPSVLVTDQYGNAIAGTAVTFAVATGGGQITGANQTTGPTGLAAVGSWTLGNTAGSNTLTATSGSLGGSPVTFTAMGGVGTASQLVIQAGNNQTATVNTVLPIPPTVRAVDANGNGVAGVAVTFVAVDGLLEGDINTIAMLTDASGDARVDWKISTTNGPNSARVISPGLSGSPVTFTATGIPDVAFKIEPFFGDGQSAHVGTTLPIAPSVYVQDQYNNSVGGVSVEFQVASGAGSITGASQTTDAGGFATVGSWTLGNTPGTNTLTATATGGGIQGNPVTFTAYGTAPWASLQNVPHYHVSAVAVVNEIIYAMQVGDHNAYDPTTNTWTTRAPMPGARGEHGAVVIDGKVYVVGGGDGNGYTAVLEVYDPATDTWATRASMPTARSRFGAAEIDGVLYAVGGFTTNGFTGNLEAYDPMTDTWTAKASLPAPRAGMAVGVMNGILYAAGGYDDINGAANTVEAYDPVTNSWSPRASLAQARGDVGGGVMNGLLYVIGGVTNTGVVATNEAYDPVTDSWSSQPAMPSTNYQMGVGVVNGRLYSVGGPGCPYCLLVFVP